MPPVYRFATREIHDLFRTEVESRGGTVRDAFDDGHRLFLRGILTNFRPVGFGDDVQAGVALRADESEVCVHPYIFRLVCKNGAIWAHALETARIENPVERPSTELMADLREAIRSCASPSAFEQAVREMRSAHTHRADMQITMGALLSQLGSGAARMALNQILEVYAQEGDTSRFGLMNAITAVARETRDPDLRWRLEEFGGGVPAASISPVFQPSAAKSLEEAYGARRAADMEDACAYTSEPLQELVGSYR